MSSSLDSGGGSALEQKEAGTLVTRREGPQGLEQGVEVDVLRACWQCPGAPGGGEGTDGRAQGQMERGRSRMQWGPAWP